MSYLEKKFLIHRDLASRNILVFNKSLVKLSDFGLSRLCCSETNYYKTSWKDTLRLPIAWMSPEAISYLRFTSSSDVFSFGVCMWECFSYGEMPWQGMSSAEVSLTNNEKGERKERERNIYQSLYIPMTYHVDRPELTFQSKDEISFRITLSNDLISICSLNRKQSNISNEDRIVFLSKGRHLSFPLCSKNVQRRKTKQMGGNKRM